MKIKKNRITSKNESLDDGRRHPINLRNENQEEPHHFKNTINYTHQISIRHQVIESQNIKLPKRIKAL